MTFQVKLADDVIDDGLAELDAVDEIHICSSQPTDYDDALSKSLGLKAVGTGFFGAPEAGSPGRKSVSGTIDDGEITANGTATYWAALDTASSPPRLLATGILNAPVAVTDGQAFTLGTINVHALSDLSALDSGDSRLGDEVDGFAVVATVEGGSVSVRDSASPPAVTELSNVALDASNLVQASTDPKMVMWDSAPYLRWTPHNYFLNSDTPATQNVTLVAGFAYTYGITGTGSLAGSDGASGTATAGSPVTFIATTTSGTFTVTGTPSSMQINRGTILTPYLATGASIRIGIPQEYDADENAFSILYEPAATNLTKWSREFGAAAWVVYTSSISSDSALAPDGSMTADTLTALVGSGSHSITYSDGNVLTAANYSRSIFVQTGTARYVQLNMAADATIWVGAIFDLSDGSVTQTDSQNATLLGADGTYIGDGWYRLDLRFTGTAVYWYMQFQAVDSATPTQADGGWGGVTWTAAGTETVRIWGAQLTLGSMTSFIPTVGGTATRAKDSISVLQSTFPAYTTEASLVFYGKYLGTPSTTTLIAWGQTDESDSILLYQADATTVNALEFVSNVTVVDFALGSITAGAAYKAAHRVKANDFHGAVNGTLASSPDTSGSMPGAADKLWFEYMTLTSAPHMRVYYLVALPRALTNGELQSWST